MRVAIVQTGLKGGMEENLSRAMKLARDCAPVDLVIFPELFLSGYGDGLKGQALKVQNIIDRLGCLCSEMGAGVICGLAEEEGGRLYNTAFVLEAGGSVARYRKINLFPGLDDPFSAGKSPLLLSFRGWPLGIMLCFDLRFPELARHLASRGASLLVYLARWPRKRAEHLLTLSRARAVENQVYVALVNATGPDLAGKSRLISPDGEVLASLDEEEGGLVVRLDWSHLRKARLLFNTGAETMVFKRVETKLTDLDSLLEELSWRRKKGQKVVFTNGCFDILHAGHVEYLRRARELGDCLVVGLNSDASVRRLKGPRRPINTVSDRALVLANLYSVDYVVVFDEDTPEGLIRAIRPDVLVKGADWPEEKIVGASFVRSYGGRVVRLPLLEGRSTSEIIRRIRPSVGS